MKILTFTPSEPFPTAVEAVIHRLYEPGDIFSITYIRASAGTESEIQIQEESIFTKLLGLFQRTPTIYSMLSPHCNEA